VYGTAPFLVDEDDEDVIRCYQFAVGSYCLGERREAPRPHVQRANGR
jgi:hypothetical protein